MTAETFVPTAAIRQAVEGHEADILKALGINGSGKQTHIHCPYPEHIDHHPSWRWDAAKRRAYCTCTRSDSIFDVVAKMKSAIFDEAKIIVAEMIGRGDLIKNITREKLSRSDAASLLNPDPENRDDQLSWNYLGHRLGIDPAAVPRPSTKIVGIKSLPYFEKINSGKWELVGTFPVAVFETVDRDGQRHAHRIYLAPKGAGKADLGVAPNDSERKPKKSATKKSGDNIGGRAVIWGDPTKAQTHIICEGIETGAAIALAFVAKIRSAGVAVLSCINAGGAGVRSLSSSDEGKWHWGKPTGQRFGGISWLMAK